MKKFYSFLLIAFIGITINTSAQAPDWQWAKSSGGTGDTDDGNSIVTDASGNVYVAGGFNSGSINVGSVTLTNTTGGGSDVFVAKYDPSGNTIWAKNFGGTGFFPTGNGFAKGVAVDAGGNVYITGYFLGTGMVFGSTTLTNTDTNYFSSGEIFIVKLDNSGTVVWAQSAGGAINDNPYSICVDANSNVFVTGYFCSSSISFGSITLTSPNNTSLATNDLFIAKYNSSGVVQWAKNVGNTGGDIGNSITTDASGNVLVAGIFGGASLVFGPNNTVTGDAAVNLFLAKYDTGGNIVWAQSAGATGSGSINSSASGVACDANDNIYIIGAGGGTTFTLDTVTISGGGFFIAKYNAAGHALWIRNTVDGAGTAIDVDAAGNAFTTGYFTGLHMIFGNDTISNDNVSGYNEDIFVAKYSATGAFQWAKSAGGTYRDIPNGIAADANGNGIITGYYKSGTIEFGGTLVTNVQTSYNDFFVAKLGEPAGIKENGLAFNSTVYPNPTNGMVLVKSKKEITKLEVMNVLGQSVIFLKPLANEAKIDLSDQVKGIYFISIVAENEKITKRIILN